MARFREILRNRNFFLLWLGQLISQVGDRLSQMALIGLVYQRAPGSSMQIAKILSFTIIPVFLIGPVAGVYVDRWDRRRTMYICDLLRAGLILSIPLFLFYQKSFLPIYAIVFLAFCIGRFFVPAKLAIIPELVEPKNLLLANSLVNTTGMIAAVVGFGVSGLLVQWLGAQKGFYFDALSFLISGIAIFLISARTVRAGRRRERGKELVELIKKSLWGELTEGFVYFAQNKSLRFTSIIIFILWSALGAVYVVSIVFIQQTLKTVTGELGLLIMFLGMGLLGGSLLYGRFGQRISPYKIIFSTLILSGIMLIVFASVINAHPHFITAAALSFALGLAVSPIMIASNTIVHHASTNNMMGKVFSSFEIIMHLGFLLCMFISSRLAELYSPGLILMSVGGIIIVVGSINLILHHKIAW
jgi:DHA3 family macrolide efflux protein-like MFS transporter